MSSTVSRTQALHAALSQAFAPSALQIVNDSHDHAGHFSGDGETHFTVHMTAEAFAGLSAVARERAATAAVREVQGLHAVSWKISAPR